MMQTQGKIPPQAQDLERAILGACLLEKDAIHRAMLIIPDNEVFFTEGHKQIYAAMIDLARAGAGVDMLTVRDQLTKNGHAETSGGIMYLTNLTSRVASSANMEYHCTVVVQKYVAREAIKATDKATNELYLNETDVFEAIDSTRRDLDKFANIAARGSVENICDAPDETVKAIEEARRKAAEARENGEIWLPGLSSGLLDLDDLLGGFCESDLTYLGARPAMGKTALIQNIATSISINQGFPVAVFQLEMTAKKMKHRLHCSISGVDSQAARRGLVGDEEIARLMDAMRILENGSILVDDNPSHTHLSIRASSRKLARERGIKCIIVDNKDIIAAASKAHSREREVAEISRNLKELAKDLKIPIIVLSQLSRAFEKQGGRRMPSKSDLKDSSACEQDADSVLLLYRPAYYGPEYIEAHYADQVDRLMGMGKDWKKVFQHIAFLRVDKAREGSTGEVALWWDAKYLKFSDLTDPDLRSVFGMGKNSLVSQPAGGHDMPF